MGVEAGGVEGLPAVALGMGGVVDENGGRASALGGDALHDGRRHGGIAQVSGERGKRRVGCLERRARGDDLQPRGREAPDAGFATLEADLADPGAPAALMDRIATERGRPVTVLVNNAAHSERDGWEALDAAGLDAHYAVNLRASALLAVELCRRLPGDRAGRVITLTSGQSKGPMPGELAYIASKGALDALCVTLAAEVAHLGVTVNNVNPGPVDTGRMDDAIRAEALPRFPMGRIGEPDDAARLVAFLASDDARWIPGQVISSEGGFIRR